MKESETNPLYNNIHSCYKIDKKKKLAVKLSSPKLEYLEQGAGGRDPGEVVV